MLGNRNVAFGDLALLGPAIHTPNPRAMGKIDPANPYVGVYPVKRRTIFFPRADELKDVADNTDKDAALALCDEYCPWTRVPALALAYYRDGDKKVSGYKAAYYDPAVVVKENDRTVFEWAIAKEYEKLKEMTTQEVAALYQWMMTSQMIGRFLSPASPQSWAQILLM